MSSSLLGCRMVRAIAAFSMAAATCWAATPISDIGNVAPNLQAVEEAGQQVRSSGCVTSQCEGIVLIADVFGIYLKGLAVTMGEARPVPLNRDVLADKALRRTLLDHPQRFGAVCEGATQLIARYGLPGEKSDLFVPVSLIQLGLDMDRVSKGHCVPALLAALPGNEAAETAISNARQMCVGKRYAAASCDEIKRP